MDWTTVVVALIGIGGILLAQLMTNQRERGQRSHQERLKEKDLEEARQQRLRDDRIKAYAQFARLTIARPTTDTSVTVYLVEAYSAITLLGGSVEAMGAAKQLYSRTLNLRRLATEVQWEGTTTPDKTYREASDAVAVAYEEFINITRTDIGHSPDVTFDFAHL